MVRRIKNMVLSAGAQASIGWGEQSVENHSRQESASSSKDVNPGKVDEVLVRSGIFIRIRNYILDTVWAVFKGVKAEELTSPKLRSISSMKRFTRSLSSPYERVQRSLKVGESWKKIQGCDGWDNLLNPLDPVLRTEIYRYAKFAEATYHAFDSKSCECKYTEKELLEQVGLENRGYEIHQFLYATSQLGMPKMLSRLLGGIPKSLSRLLGVKSGPNWIGFVAVCTSPAEIDRIGRRDIVVAWRGTITMLEWIKDIQFWLTSFAFGCHKANNGVKVESGFLSVYTSSNQESLKDKRSARDQVLHAVKELVEKHKKENLSITVTGHSLGSALATLCAFDISQQKWTTQYSQRGSSSKSVPRKIKSLSGAFPSDRIPVTVFSFAGPRVGNSEFNNRIDSTPGLAVLRVVNKQDLVTKVPIGLFQQYTHVGVELNINDIEYENPEEILEETRRQIISTVAVYPNHFFSMTAGFPGGFHYFATQHSIQLYMDTMGRGFLWMLVLERRASYYVTMFCVKLRGKIVRKFFTTRKRR